MPEKEYVICRTTAGSNFAGFLESREGRNAVLTQVQRLRVELRSQPTQPPERGIYMPLERLTVTGVMEIFPVTPVGRALIEAGHVLFFVVPGQSDAFDKIRRA